MVTNGGIRVFNHDLSNIQEQHYILWFAIICHRRLSKHSRKHFVGHFDKTGYRRTWRRLRLAS